MYRDLSQSSVNHALQSGQVYIYDTETTDFEWRARKNSSADGGLGAACAVDFLQNCDKPDPKLASHALSSQTHL